MATQTTTKQVIDRATADTVMRAVDEATKTTLAAMGLEAFRFDADVHDVEGFIVLKIKIRPVGPSREL